GVLYTWGEEYLPAENARFGIEASETAEEIGFRDGDFILSVDHQPVDDFYNIVPTIVLEGAESVQVRRNGIETEVLIDTDDIAVMMKTRNLIGLRFPFKMLITDFGKESPAREAGMLKGDEVLRINGMEFEFHDQFVCELNKHRDEELQVTVRRDSQLIDIPLRLTAEGMMGVQWNNNFSEYFEFKTIEYGFWESIPAGIALGYQTSVDYLKQFKLIFNRKTKGYESLGGFITIGSIFPGQWNWHAFWNMTAFLSIILAIMNILPIPALDGGHVLFVLYEMITGRKPNEKFLEYAQIAGLILLLLLVLYANANDVIRLFTK
ncbi:MAG TPA: site-2 protease family protein, partial [Prolixibacteraceae bacterium]|nr:site-2 protease family protein [Prolixibacteraceae bacterium]